MSRIGKKPIKIPEGVTAVSADGFLTVRGPAGELRLKILPHIKAEIKDSQLFFAPENDERQTRANWGTTAALARNALIGASRGFKKVLELEGIGYRAGLEGDALVLNVGFTHPVKFKTPAGIQIKVEKNRITVSGIDKFLVGETAAKIRKIKKPEPYKGKGIHYLGEIIRRKAGKKAAGERAVTVK